MSVRLRLSMVFLLLMSFAVGCGTNTNTPASISGKVTYKGQVVTAGTITFQMNEGGAYTRAIPAGGTYSIPDLPAGEAVVVIETESANPAKKKEEYKGGSGKFKTAGPPSGKAPQASPPPDGVAAGGSSGGAYVPIPEKYASPKTSPLRVTIQAGSQTRNFELEP
jgi:hypothetical protein